MLKIIFIIIIILHGLIHLMGFVKAYGYADVSALKREISKPMGIIWLVATVLFVTTAILFAFGNDAWVYVGIASMIVSQAMIWMYWQDAKLGSIVNVLVLIVVFSSFFHQDFKYKYKREVTAGLTQTSNIPSDILTEEDIKHLPPLIQKYIRYSQSVGKPKIHNFKVTMSGEIRSYESQDWMSFTSEQYNFIPATTRLFFLNATKKLLPVSGLQSFKGGVASMDIRLLSTFNLQNMEGKEMNVSETVTFFHDLCWLAPGALIDERIRWKISEGNRVSATFTFNGITIAAWLYFNQKGELVNFESEDRYAVNIDGKNTQLSWRTPLEEYKEIGGYRLASYATTITTYDNGDFVNATFNIDDVKVNLTK
ncbi:MAG TPA: hypothetical protein PJ990_08670 [Saprospiraceae bacterium]|nr:hypothetical protein [Saprospiraceae bacterium]